MRQTAYSTMLRHPPRVTLSALRTRLGVTQEEVSQRLGLAQSNVSRLERRDDMRVGTLRRLVEALGGELELVVRLPSEVVHLTLGEPEPETDAGDAPRGSVEDRLRRFLASDAAPPLVSAYLFGSVAEGREHAESDVDVGVLLGRDRYPSAEERSEARIGLASALVQALGRNEVDVVILDDAPPELARRIVVEGRPLACRDPERDRAFVRDAQLRAADLAPFLRRMRRIKLEALRG